MEEIEISLKSIQKTGKQISGNLKLLLLIKGQLEVSVCDKVYQMKPNQILLIDRNQPHSLRGSHQNV
ncbi:MAG TPA: AraC family ligand binding domain-containing protein, partial [Lachnospiraceae bacterium]|nr:AraC family ligand binding domain-containing protein [Lachnospiraceae bacterium]